MSLSPRGRLPHTFGSSPEDAAHQRHAIAAVLQAGLQTLRHFAPGLQDPLEAELLGSDAASIWWAPSSETDTQGEEFEQRVGRAYATALEGQGDPPALAALRALQLGGSNGIASAAAEAADRLAGTGVADPPWWPAPPPRCVRAARIVWVDDGRAHLLALELQRDQARWTLGMLVLDDRSGVACDLRIFPDLDELQAKLRPDPATDPSGIRVLQGIDPAVARDEMRQAIERTDLLGTTNDGHGYVALRGLTQRWLAALDSSEPPR